MEYGKSSVKRLLLIALTAIALETSRARADDFEPVREFIRQKLGRQEAPSIALAVVRDGKVLWEEAFGWADKEKKRAATPNTAYRLGSVSKPVTATAVPDALAPEGFAV